MPEKFWLFCVPAFPGVLQIIIGVHSLRSVGNSMEKTLLILSPLRKQTGNTTTALRICDHVRSFGYPCILKGVEEFHSAESFQKFIKDEKVRAIVGLHSYYSGILLQGCQVPFIMILTGTDINKFYKDTDKNQVMTNTVSRAKFVVTFSSTLLKKARELWSSLPQDVFQEIPQAVLTCPSTFSLRKYLLRNVDLPPGVDLQHLSIFLLVAGIRPVKDPLYLVPAFSEWHKRNETVIYVILGPVIDWHYYEKFERLRNGLPGIYHIPGLDLPDTHAAIQQSTILVNSSESEAMSAAILEAMDLSVPVIARKIPSNSDLIEDGFSGLLFRNPQEFIERAEVLLSTPELRQKIIHNAKMQVNTKHQPLDEWKSYYNLLKNPAMNLNLDET